MTSRLLVILFCSAIAAACGQIFFKLGATGQTTLTDFVNRWNFAGVVAYGMGTVLWIFALSKAPLTTVYPFTALTFVLAYTSGAVIFKESISLSSAAGVGLILLGLYLTAR